MRGRKVSAWIWFALAACEAVLIFVFSAQSDAESGRLSGELTKALIGFINPAFANLSEPEQRTILAYFHPLVRKAGHFGEYALLGALLCAGFSSLRKAPSVMTFVPAAICALYAAGDEFHQRFVSGRAMEAADFLTDCLGAAAGIVLAALIALSAAYLRLRRKKKGRGRDRASGYTAAPDPEGRIL